MQEYRNLQNEILQVKRTLLAVQIPNSIESVTVNTLEDLSRDIDFYNVSVYLLIYLFNSLYIIHLNWSTDFVLLMATKPVICWRNVAFVTFR